MISIKFIIFVVMVILIKGASSSEKVWNQFRGPSGQGHAMDILPIAWSWEGKNLLWRTEIEGRAWSSPISVGKGIIISNARVENGSENLLLEAIAINPQDGSEMWRTILFKHKDMPRIHRKNSYASPTPFYDGDKIFIHFGNLGTACLTVDGVLVWKKTFNYSPVHGGGSSPVVFKNLLIFSADGAENPSLYALNKKNGSIAWKSKRSSDAKKNFSFCTPLIIPHEDGMQIISPASDWCFSYDMRGREIWKSKYTGGYSVVPRPVFSQGLVYVSSGYDHPTLYAIEVDGFGEVTSKKVKWKTSKAVPRNSSPLLVAGYLFMVSDAGVVSCLDALSGELKWMERVASSTSASLLYSNGLIYLTEESGQTFIFKSEPNFKLVAKNDLREKTLSSPMSYGNSLIIRTEKAIYRIGKNEL